LLDPQSKLMQSLETKASSVEEIEKDLKTHAQRLTIVNQQ
jgi:hypothetical protein